MKRILLLFLIFAFSSQVYSQCDTIKERETLMILFNAMDGSNWGQVNWDENTALKDWTYVTINENGCVTELIFNYSGIKGQIPPEIGRLKMLKTLDFERRQLNSTIPPEIGQLQHLEYLNFHKTKLYGEIPPEIGNLTKLKFISLRSNNLSGKIPPEIGNMSDLEYLYFHGNKLTGEVPVEISQLSNLKELNLAFNDLSGLLPAHLANLDSIKYISISDNNFSGCFPQELLDLSCNQAVSLSMVVNPLLPFKGWTDKICFNNAEQIGAPCDDGDDRTKNDVIEDDCSCAGLEEPLDCGFQRDILKGFYRLSGGDNWINNENWKSDKPLSEWYGVEASSLDGCPTAIRLPANNLSGTINPDIGKLKKLKYLDLSNNHISGEVSNQISFLPRIVDMKLNDNKLSGEIPPSLGDESYHLVNLDLSNNQFSGSIPANIGHLNELKHINLSKNMLSGSIPLEIGFLNVESIYFDQNLLSGCFPDTVVNKFCHLEFSPNDTLGGYNFSQNFLMPFTGNLAQICPGVPQIGAPCVDGNSNTSGETIDEDCACKESSCQKKDRETLVKVYNALGGSDWYNNSLWESNQYIGEWFGVTTNTEGCVVEINLPDNNLKGELPKELDEFIELKQLNLYKNEISGSIPKELGNLKHLEVLRLFKNNITGSLPTELGDMEQLQILNISQNNISGVIPESFGQLSNLKSLLLFKNDLTGNIPASLGNLKNLDDLSLEHNQLAGNIPTELGNLKKLTKLDFSFNQLSGTIPTELGTMEMISELRLTHNNLTSMIPDELGNLSHLYWLHLSENNLYGCIPNILIQRQCDENKKFQFNDNPLLPHQGDLSKLCSDVTQIGAPCDDGDPSTPNDKIDENCLCNGKTVATNNILHKPQIKIYPNPASDVLHFEIENKNWHGNTNIVFYNLLGEEVRRLVISDASNFLDYRIDIPNGVYFCRVGMQIFKVVISH